jgi:hypothetical protein
MGVTPAGGPTVGTRNPSPMRHIITVTPRIAEALASPFSLDPPITAIGTADRHISIIGITAGVVIDSSLTLDGLPTIIAVAREPGSEGVSGTTAPTSVGG